MLKVFAIMQINGFEQLLTNYLYEKIQQLFVDFNFRQQQEEYIRDEIEWQPIDITSNDLLCDLHTAAAWHLLNFT